MADTLIVPGHTPSTGRRLRRMLLPGCFLILCLSVPDATPGATTQPDRAAAPMPVLSANPLGDLKPGEWYAAPHSKLRNVLPAPLLPRTAYNGPETIMSAWSGGAYDTKRDRLIVWGGGHADYYGNEVYAFDVQQLAWQRLTDPSRPTPRGAPSVSIHADGTPVSRHTYDGLEYLPNVDKFWATGGSRWWDGYVDPHTWTFDFTTLTWARVADLPWPPRSQDLQVVSAYDPVTGHVFMASPTVPLFQYDPHANTWIKRSNEPVGSRKVAAIDPVRRQFVVIGQGQALAYPLPATGMVAQRVLQTRGDTSILAANYPGFEYDPVGDRFVAWNGGADVYTLNMDTLLWTKHPPAPTNTILPTRPSPNGTYGRFRYVPSKDVFVVVNSIHEEVFFYKLAADARLPRPKAAASSRTSGLPSPPSRLSKDTIRTPRGPSDMRIAETQAGPGALDPAGEAHASSQSTSRNTLPGWQGARAVAGADPETKEIYRPATPKSAPVSDTTAPPQPHTRRIDLPLRQWVALLLPDWWKWGGKHMTGALNPDNGRLYFTGGDYRGSPYYHSYRQETYSVSLAERFAAKANPHAGWRLEYPYCGPPGQTQPKHPDYVGWTWDPTRRVFWMIPGMMLPIPSNCPGETNTPTSDPGFALDRIMTFDPITRKWTVIGEAGKSVETWGSVYDSTTDTIIRFNWDGGHGAQVGIYDIARKAWTYAPLGQNALGKDIRIHNSIIAADLPGRAIYAIDPHAGRLHRYRIDARKIEDLGATPGGALRDGINQPQIVWDPLNQVLLWAAYLPPGFFAYHPKTQRWETLSTATDVPGTLAVGRVMVFDPLQNVVVLFGTGEIEDMAPPLGPMYRASVPYMFLYRYGNGPGAGGVRLERLRAGAESR